MSKHLSAAERKKLERLEAVVERGRAAYAEAAEALATIKAEKLYKPLTWGAYVKKRFGESAYWWCRDILIWHAMTNWTGVQLSQKAARVLYPMPPEKRRAVVSLARKLTKGDLTEDVLRRARSQFLKPAGKPSFDIGLTFGRFQDHPPEPGTVDLVFSDPPYGRDWLENWSSLGSFCMSALKPGAKAIFYIGNAYLPEILDALRGAGLEYLWTIARPQAYHGSFSERLGGRTLWTPLLAFGKPPCRQLGMSDLLPAGKLDVSLHRWQKPECEAIRCIERLTTPGALIVDPTCGSGTAGAAVMSLGDRRFHGWEADPEMYKTAARRLGIKTRKKRAA